VPPRIAPLAPPYPPGLAEELAATMPPGVPPIALFRTLAHNPRVLRKLRLANLLDRGSLERRDRELVILRATARCGCAYEWGVHVAYFAERVGLAPEVVRASALGRADDPAFGPRERALVAMVDELHETARLSDAAFAALAAHFAPAQVVELLVLAGFYHAIAFVANGLAIEPEPFAPGLPAGAR
jgi:alkylhydroperoxidase family enzyme